MVCVCACACVCVRACVCVCVCAMLLLPLCILQLHSFFVSTKSQMDFVAVLVRVPHQQLGVVLVSGLQHLLRDLMDGVYLVKIL